MSIRITHLSVFEFAISKPFASVTDYDSLNAAIKAYGLSKGTIGSDDYNKAGGALFEVYTEFFCRRYEGVMTGIHKILDTSDDPFTAGYDFVFTSNEKDLGLLQSKWRSNPVDQFKLGDLATFGFKLNARRVTRSNGVFFTNLVHTAKRGIFHYTCDVDARRQMRIFDRSHQEEYLDRTPTFWNEFRLAIEESSIEDIGRPPAAYDYQDSIVDRCEPVLQGYLERGRIRAATGAGKTLCMFTNVRRMFQLGGQVVVVVEPSRALIDQTFREFYKWGMFEDTDCLVLRSGGRPRHNPARATVLQTLSSDLAVEFATKTLKIRRQLLIFVTNRSHANDDVDSAISGLQNSITVNLKIIDEYHEMVSSGTRQEQQVQHDWLLNLRSERQLCYSASEKGIHGDLISTFDPTLFGPLLQTVSYNDLRQRGVVVPKIHVRFIRVDKTKVSRSLSATFLKVADRDGLDLAKLTAGAAGIVIAAKEEERLGTSANLLVVGDKVRHCELVTESEEVQMFLPKFTLHFADGDTSSIERESIFNCLRESNYNILCQHSIAGVGINIVNLSAAVTLRSQGVIGIQQYLAGRPTRANPIDTAAFKRGELKLDNPTSWIKYFSTIYVVIDDNDDVDYNFIKTLVFTLETECGLTPEQWDAAYVMEERLGDKDPNDDKPDVPADPKLEHESLVKAIVEARLESLKDQQVNRVESASYEALLSIIGE